MIKRKTWSDGAVSAYLDGELDATTRDAFEAAMAQDRNLRRQVDDVREVVAVMRAVSLREPPRNYLLTSGMVAETPPKRVERRRTPLLLMRLATSLAAAAFVVTVGLSVISRGVSPAMVTQSDAEFRQLVAATQEVEKLVEAEVPVVEAAPSEKAVEKALSPEDEAAFAPLPQDAPAAGALGEGIGDGVGEEKAAPGVVESAPALEDAAADTATEALGEVVTEGEAQREGVRVMGDTAAITETVAPASLPAVNDVDDREAGVSVRVAEFPPPWLPGVLGVVTLVLVGITIWTSRKR